MVTADVVGLYPHIPHGEGLLGVLREALAKSPSASVPADDLVDLARLVLKNNNLTFNGRHYLQIQGTSIGTKMAPSFANIFMATLEPELLEGSLKKPFFLAKVH